MVNETASRELTLQLRRTFAAPREKVFRAWTDPEALKQWFGAPGCKTETAEVDLRIGGRYRLGVRLPDQQLLTKFGTYEVIEPPQRLVMTWAWEPAEEDARETRVSVNFLEQGAQTEVVLTHELLPNKEIRDQHDMGWNACFDGLERFTNQGGSGG